LIQGDVPLADIRLRGHATDGDVRPAADNSRRLVAVERYVVAQLCRTGHGYRAAAMALLNEHSTACPNTPANLAR
jgi:hypothetical protein